MAVFDFRFKKPKEIVWTGWREKDDQEENGKGRKVGREWRKLPIIRDKMIKIEYKIFVYE